MVEFSAAMTVPPFTGLPSSALADEAKAPIANDKTAEAANLADARRLSVQCRFGYHCFPPLLARKAHVCFTFHRLVVPHRRQSCREFLGPMTGDLRRSLAKRPKLRIADGTSLDRVGTTIGGTDPLFEGIDAKGVTATATGARIRVPCGLGTGVHRGAIAYTDGSAHHRSCSDLHDSGRGT